MWMSIEKSGYPEIRDPERRERPKKELLSSKYAGACDGAAIEAWYRWRLKSS
jgi:hypothetical protein